MAVGLASGRRRRCSISSRTPSSKRCSSSAPARSSHAPPRAGHLEDGRAAETDADHVPDLSRSARSRSSGVPGFSGFFSKDAILVARLRKATCRSSGLGALHRVPDRVLHDAAGRGRLLRQAAQRTRGARRSESPAVMIVPLVHPRDSRSHRRLRIFRAALSRRCLNEERADHRVPMLALALLLVGVGARRPALSQPRERPARSSRSSGTDFTSTRFTTSLIGATQGAAGTLSRLHRSLDLDGGDRRGLSGATWGAALSCGCSKSATCRPTRSCSASASSGSFTSPFSADASLHRLLLRSLAAARDSARRARRVDRALAAIGSDSLLADARRFLRLRHRAQAVFNSSAPGRSAPSWRLNFTRRRRMA